MKELKILNKYFDDILYNNKRFELRKDDKNYKVNDVITLREYDIEKNQYTCYSVNKITIMITYILRNVEQFGLNKDYCIFGFEILFKQEFEMLRSSRALSNLIKSKSRM